MQKYVISPGTHDIKCADDAAQYTIFISDMLWLKICDTMSVLLPADDGIIVFLTVVEITECRVVYTFMDSLLDVRQTDKVHICNPHRNDIKAVFDCNTRKMAFAFCRQIDRNGIMTIAFR